MITSGGKPINVGPKVTAYIMLNLMSLLLGIKRESISSMMSRENLKASNVEDCVFFIRSKTKGK